MSEDGRNEQSEPENEQSEPENEQSECDLDVEILEYRRREEDKVKYIDFSFVNYKLITPFIIGIIGLRILD